MNLADNFEQEFKEIFFDLAQHYKYLDLTRIKQKEIKDLALEDALQKLPEARSFIESRLKEMSNSDIFNPTHISTEDQAMGRLLLGRMGRVVKQYVNRHKVISEEPLSIKDRFIEACRQGYVPNADTVAILLNCHPSYPVKLMRGLKEEFSFVKVPHGFKVTHNAEAKKKKRMTEIETQINEMIKEQQKQLLALKEELEELKK